MQGPFQCDLACPLSKKLVHPVKSYQRAAKRNVLIDDSPPGVVGDDVGDILGEALADGLVIGIFIENSRFNPGWKRVLLLGTFFEYRAESLHELKGPTLFAIQFENVTRLEELRMLPVVYQVGWVLFSVVALQIIALAGPGLCASESGSIGQEDHGVFCVVRACHHPFDFFHGHWLLVATRRVGEMMNDSGVSQGANEGDMSRKAKFYTNIHGGRPAVVDAEVIDFEVLCHIPESFFPGVVVV